MPRYYISKEDDSLVQIPPEVRKTVAFACFRDRRTNGAIGLGGTAFFVALGSRNISLFFGYAVTAKHVIAKIQQYSTDGKVLLRVNVKEGPSQFLESDASDWRFHPDDPVVDVAVLPLFLPQDKFDVLPIGMEMAVTEQVFKDHAIGVGDEVFLPGLFVNHFGRQQNLPIVRVGNIAAMPEEPVATELGLMDAYLVEARSVGGLSGSPVFVSLGSTRTFGNQTRLATGNIFYWLGLMHGHFQVGPISNDDVVSQDASGREYVNMGIAIVVPVSKILEVINQEAFAKAREAATCPRGA